MTAVISMLAPELQRDIHGGNRTKYRQTPPGRFVVLLKVGLVHSEQLEDEIRQSSKENNHHQPHRNLFLPPGAPGSKNQESDGNWQGGDRQVEFVVSACGANPVAGGRRDDDDKLDGESNEEEKVKLQKGNENLYQLCISFRSILLGGKPTWNVR